MGEPGRGAVEGPESRIPLTAATFEVLLSLAGGERHGYAIMREAEERSGGRIRLGPGTLYGTLKRLLEGGLIEEVGERSDPELGDERRRYYRLTEYGLAVVRAEARRLEAVVGAARRSNLIGLEPAS